ncbi:NAD(P)-binding domain-containing protein [Burkholderia sp. Ap-962]|uniref:NAD(P)-binding domain-containing protein n=1 Tax=Burkholderia sp. Ap-962 TaxID=2608333 RepID=UPI0019639760|nr:NAD(P)-binding domain-containing protein [Burkholderia sp. Ap-962]
MKVAISGTGNMGAGLAAALAGAAHRLAIGARDPQKALAFRTDVTDAGDAS